MESAKRIRLVVLGDSITVGCHETGVTEETSYPHLLQRLISLAGLNVEMIISARHGAYTDYVVRRFDRMVLRHAPNFVLILLGSNDAGSTATRPTISPHDYQAALASIVSMCRDHDAVPIVSSPPPRSDINSQDSLKHYASASRQVAKEFCAEFVDLYEKLVDVRALKDLFPDGLHPSPAGNQVIADLLADKMLPLLRDSI